jgi:hypothetical protein
LSTTVANKTVNQAIQFHVQQNQKGWVKALPQIRFTLMNTENASTGFSPFQLCMGCSPHIIPPIVPSNLPTEILHTQESSQVKLKVEEILHYEAEATDNLLQAKVMQAHFANQQQGMDNDFVIGDCVMLSTLHWWHQYKSKNKKQVAKFFPCFDGPYTILRAHPKFFTHTLNKPNSLLTFPTFHASQMKCFIANDSKLFPTHEHPWPWLIVTMDGIEEYSIQEIINVHRWGHGWSFFVWWVGYGPEEDWWLPGVELTGCKVLGQWISAGRDGPW